MSSNITKLGSVAEVLSGYAFKSEWFQNSGTPVIRIGDIFNKEVNASTCVCVNEQNHKIPESCRAKEGDILMALSGATTGKIGIVRANLHGAFVNQRVAIIRSSEPITQQYIQYLFNGRLLECLLDRAWGAAQENLSPKALKELEISCPSLEEQRRIADILDRADAVRRKRQQAIALTEELLRSAFLEMFGDPVTNSKGWKVEPLGEIAKFVGGGTPSRKEPKYFEGNICWATSKDMNVDLLLDTEEHITLEAIKDSATKLVEPECLLIVVKSKVLMRRLPVARTVVPTCFGQDVKAIIPNQNWMTRYLHRHLKFGAKTLLQQARGVNTEGLTLEHLRNYKVMIPTRLDIKHFTDLDIAVETGLRTRKSLADISGSLFNSLLQSAFRGEL